MSPGYLLLGAGCLLLVARSWLITQRREPSTLNYKLGIYKLQSPCHNGGGRDTHHISAVNGIILSV